MTYKTKITTSAQVVKVLPDGTEEVIFGGDRYLTVRTCEMICSDLNKGFLNVKIEDYE